MRLCEYIQRIASQAELSRKAGVSHASLSYFLNGKRGLSPVNIAKIVIATDGQVSYEELINEIVELQECAGKTPPLRRGVRQINKEKRAKNNGSSTKKHS